jgi:hypothetical protein
MSSLKVSREFIRIRGKGIAAESGFLKSHNRTKAKGYLLGSKSKVYFEPKRLMHE